MASLRWEMNDRPTFSAITPHFFKVILEDTLEDSKLKIPKKFVGQYGNDLSNLVCLKLPSGAEWHMELKKCNGEAWFEKGWPEFSEFYSLDCCHWLVFRYEGNSKFHVCIFDRSATEIDYPITSINCDRPADVPREPTMPQMEATEDDISVEILEEFPSCPKTREKSPLEETSVDILEDFPPFPKTKQQSPSPCPWPQQKKRIRSNSKAESNTNLQKGVPHLKPEMKSEDGGGSLNTQRFPKQTPEVLGRMHPLTRSEKAKALERVHAFKSKNPSFKVVMQPSYLRTACLNVPSEFVRKHHMKQPGNVILQVPDGRSTWSVNFTYKNSKGRFRDGWSKFVRDNNLKVGDVCVFMMINKIKRLFKVVFSRTTEAANWPFSPGYGRGAIDQVKKERSPINKVESDCTMNCEIGTTTNQVDPNEFEGKYKMYSKLGGQVTHTPSSLRVLEAANKFIPTNPFFKVFLGSASKLSKVHVPASFSKSYLKEKKQTAMLQVRGRSWPVNLIANNQSFRISAGWPTFAKENCLREGVVCIFELIELNDIVLKVHIFRG